jgi:hypothetical protein
VKQSIKYCFLCFLLSRLIVLGVAYATFYSFDTPPAPPGYAETQGPLDRKPLNVLFFYDSVHYLTIVNEGYGLFQTAWFPLYPLLIRLTGGTAASAVAVSNIMFFLGLLAVFKLGGRKAVLLTSVSPIGIVFSAAYSESLFFCICSWFFVFLKEQKYLYAGTLAGLGAMCRSPGWVLIAVLAFSIFDRYKIKDKVVSLGVGGLIGLLFPAFLLAVFKDVQVFTIVNNALFSRVLMPFWWGTVQDISRLFTGQFYPALITVVVLNLSGWLWIFASFFAPRLRLSGILYALMVLSFPITRMDYVHATFGLLRYACVWPGAYLGLEQMLRTKTGYYLFIIASSALAVFVSFLVAQKAFIF